MSVTIPRGTRIDGLLETEADLEVAGRVDGRIAIAGTLHVVAGASCRATVTAHSARIAGEVLGTITCTHSITVAAGGRVVGDLRAPEVEVDGDAQVDGRVDLLAPSAEQQPVQRAPARVTGPGFRRPTPPLPVTEIEVNEP